MTTDRITRENPSGSYRIPAFKAISVRMEWQGGIPVFFGVPVDKLGKYEDIGTPEEFALLKKMYEKTKK